MNTQNAWVLGAGFAGVQAAKALLRHCPDARVTVVDRNGYSTMLPALPDVLSGRVRQERLGRPLGEVFPRRYRNRLSIREGCVTEVDLDRQTLVLQGETLSWDYLVIATGSLPAPDGGAPSWSGTIHSIHSLESTLALRRDLEQRLRATRGDRDSTTVLVLGAGYTGLEAAVNIRRGAIAAGLPSPEITVLEKAETFLPFLREKERRYILTYLETLNVTIRTGVSLDSIDDQRAILSDGSEVRAPLVVRAAGMRSDTVPITGAVEYSRDGRLKTNALLQLPQYPRVFAAGDAAALEKDGTLQRRAVNFAFYSGRRAGKNLGRVMRGAPDAAAPTTSAPDAAAPTTSAPDAAAPTTSAPDAATGLKPFRPVDLGWVIPLGGVSVGLVFGLLRVRGRLGLRMHYAMSGFRHFGLREALEFYWTALFLRRTPDPLHRERPPE